MQKTSDKDSEWEEDENCSKVFFVLSSKNGGIGAGGNEGGIGGGGTNIDASDVTEEVVDGLSLKYLK